MSVLNDILTLSHNEIEDIEKLTLRWLVQATLDFGFEAYDIFRASPSVFSKKLQYFFPLAFLRSYGFLIGLT